MPVVKIKYNPDKIPWQLMHRLSEGLPPIIAVALNVPANPSACLTITDIELWFEKIDPNDMHTKDLRILIFAHDYPERRQDLQDRTNEINAGLREILGEVKVTGWVWVHLNTTAFEKI